MPVVSSTIQFDPLIGQVIRQFRRLWPYVTRVRLISGVDR